MRLVVFVTLSAACIALLIAAMVLFNYDRQAARYDITAVGRMPLESTVTDGTGAAAVGSGASPSLPGLRAPPGLPLRPRTVRQCARGLRGCVDHCREVPRVYLVQLVTRPVVVPVQAEGG